MGANKIGTFLSGFMLGGFVGTAISLLTAPQSGEKTRLQIRQKGLELRDQAVESAEEARRRAEEAAAQARTRVEGLTAGARARAEELQQRGKEILEGQKEVLEAAIDGARRSGRKKQAELASEDIPTAFPN